MKILSTNDIINGSEEDNLQNGASNIRNASKQPRDTEMDSEYT